MTETTTTGPARVAPEGYIRAVLAALAHRGVQADQIHVRTTPTRRAAMALAETDPVSTMWRSVEWIRLRWQDNRGWELQVRWPGEPTPRAPLAFRISAVPPPHELAAWVVLCLIHPEIAVLEDDTPVTTADVEEVLRAYAAGTAD
jgi:hypothetical protein